VTEQAQEATGPRAHTPRRAWLVWAAGLGVYIAAVVHRSSFGVTGLVAADRFGVDATTLSLFVVVQVSVYAALQLPGGIALDRFGPRAVLTVGSATMAAGQLVMALAPDVRVALAARVLIGSGDAAIFVSAVRLAGSWFDRRRVPLLTQLTGIVGQLGQVISALPFALALHAFGWTPAFLGLVLLGAGATTLALTGVRNAPAGFVAAQRGAGVLREMGPTLRHPGTWLGFFTHMLGGAGVTVFVLMWGVPFLVQGQGLTPAQAGGLLTVNVLAGIAAGPVIGEFTARHPLRRSWAVLAVAATTATGWLILLVPSTPQPLGMLAVAVAAISVGGPASVIGLDFAATSHPVHRTGAAQAVANSGGFVAAVIVMLAVGVVLDHRAPGGSPTLTDYRVALSLIGVPWLVALTGVLLTRARTRAAMAEDGVLVPPLAEAWARWRAGLRSGGPADR